MCIRDSSKIGLDADREPLSAEEAIGQAANSSAGSTRSAKTSTRASPRSWVASLASSNFGKFPPFPQAFRVGVSNLVLPGRMGRDRLQFVGRIVALGAVPDR